MSYIKSLQIWIRLKRQLRSLIIRIGTNKPIDWKYELNEFLMIIIAITKIRNKTQQSQNEINTSLHTQQFDEQSKKSPYDELVPKRDK
jgi:hypothetical protein